MGINVLIADDQILFADNLKLMLETLTEDIKVVDIAHNGSEATEMSERYKPDIILMDVRMPIKDGVEATKEIKHILPNTKIIMLTMFVDDQYVEDALRNGAEGYLESSSFSSRHDHEAFIAHIKKNVSKRIVNLS